jgi:hypothetical protein
MADSSALPEPEFRQFFEYWNELRGSDIAPARADFDPLKLAALMPNMSILQWLPPDTLRWRLMGTAIVDQTSLERTGSNLLDVMYPPQRAMVLEHSAPTFELPAIALNTSHRCFASGKTVQVDFAWFPFRNADGRTDIVIGVHKPNMEQAARVLKTDGLVCSYLTHYSYVDIGAGIPNMFYDEPMPAGSRP